jgi:hypothetical protein
MSGCNKKEELTKVRLAEVTHSMFYAPLYVAIENGYFEDEGLDVELILTSGADKVSAAVLSNTVEIGFAGPESAIYIYENGEKDLRRNVSDVLIMQVSVWFPFSPSAQDCGKQYPNLSGEVFCADSHKVYLL